jgi:cholesterol oxidase
MMVLAEPAMLHAAVPRRRRLRVDAAQIHPFTTDDGVELRLTRHQGGRRGPVMLVHCIGVSSRMYSLDTISTNLLEYLYAAGFDVWLLDMRLSIDLAAQARQSSFDEIARYDFPSAVRLVLAVSGAHSIQIVAHGIGAQTFSMAMLSGLRGVRSAVCSQVAIHPIPAPLNRIKSYMGMPTLLGWLGVNALHAVPQPHGGWTERMFALGARLQPIAPAERCDSATCRRISAMYGPLYRHARLDDATHASLPEQFGQANLRAFRHLIRNLRAGHVVREDGTDSYAPHLGLMAIPILFVHGADNDCLLPKSTEVSLETLAERNGSALYRRELIPGYGHVDCIIGEHAERDVYPYILGHLEEAADP